MGVGFALVLAMAPPLLLLTALVAAAPDLPPDAPVASPPPVVNVVRGRAKWVALGGSALLAAGATLWIVGNVQYAQAAASLTEPAALASAQENALHNTLGGAGLAVFGACVLWISAEMWQWPDAPATVSAAPLPGGGALWLSGRLP